MNKLFKTINAIVVGFAFTNLSLASTASSPLSTLPSLSPISPISPPSTLLSNPSEVLQPSASPASISIAMSPIQTPSPPSLPNSPGVRKYFRCVNTCWAVTDGIWEAAEELCRISGGVVAGFAAASSNETTKTNCASAAAALMIGSSAFGLLRKYGQKRRIELMALGVK